MAKRDIPKISGEVRERLGTRYATRLRKEGRLPGIVYGHKQEPVSISVDYRELTDLLHNNHHLISLDVNGSIEACLVKDMQWNHLGTKIVHVDLARVDLSELVEVEVPVELIGEPAALLEAGAVLNHPLTSIEVRCRADQIPDAIYHDISNLAAGESVTVGDLKLDEGLEAVTDADTLIAQIQVQDELTEEEIGAGGAEPVIGRTAEEEAAKKA